MKLSGTYQLLVYADDVNILGGCMHTIKKNIDTLVVASKKNGLDVTLIKLNIWSYLEIKMQDKEAVERLITVPMKGWKGSNIQEKP
jgi:hypothetical protein